MFKILSSYVLGREQFAGALSSPSLDIKKMNVNDENNEQIYEYGFKGGSVIDYTANRDHTRAAMEEMTKMNLLENVETNGLQRIQNRKEQGSQRLSALEDNMFLHCGQNNPPRGSMLESKPTIEKSSLTLKSTISADGQVLPGEKHLIPGETGTTMRSTSQAVGPYIPPIPAIGTRRSQSDFNISRNTGCKFSDVRYCLLNSERQDQHVSSSPDKVDTASACPRNTGNGSSDLTSGMAAFNNGDDAMQRAPSVCQKVGRRSSQWPRINLSLSWKERADDFIECSSKLPTQPRECSSKLLTRSKKRPRELENIYRSLLPGNALCDITRGCYDVKKKYVKKKPCDSLGSKAMEDCDNKSE